MAEPDHFRLFVAIPMPEEICVKVLPAQAELEKAASKARIRWTPPEQFHLTLRFLGDVHSDRVEALTDALRHACLRFKPLRLQASGIGFFPNPKYPRVVWVGLTSTSDISGPQPDELAALQQAVQDACQEFTSEPADKKFSGHITLGRIKAINRHDAQALSKAADSMAVRSFGQWTAENVELVRSELGQNGATHQTLTKIPLTSL
jgi:2'-5' RNA ligase